jgi:hypothetical protein
MSNAQLLELVPLWAVLAGTVAIVLLSMQGGLLLARVRRRQDGKQEESPIGTAVGALLALLAFMLAFTFGIAANRFDARRGLLLEEVNAIGTTFLRAGLIPEPHRTEVRAMLRAYVDVRLDAADHPERLPAAIRESEKLQERLWNHATSLAQADLRNPPIASLFVDSLNQMIDSQTRRVTVGRYRIPTIIWMVFGVLTVLSMAAVGYQFGQSGKGSLPMQLVLALAFSIVVFLIADLDRTAEGWLKISNQPTVELRRQLE